MRETSMAARRSIPDEQISAVQTEILHRLDVHPMTDEELFERLQESAIAVSPSGARSRRAELVAMGLVADMGQERQSKAGRWMTVWTAVRKVDNGMRPNAMPGRPDRYVNMDRARNQAAESARRASIEDDIQRRKDTPYLATSPRVEFGQRICMYCRATGGNLQDGPCWACSGRGVR